MGVNPIDMCRKCNAFVYPELVLHAALTVLFFVCFQWTPFLLNLPLVLFHAYRVATRRHLLDATRVFSRIESLQRIGFIKLGFMMLMFFLYLYKLVFALVRAIAHSQDDDDFDVAFGAASSESWLGLL